MNNTHPALPQSNRQANMQQTATQEIDAAIGAVLNRAEAASKQVQAAVNLTRIHDHEEARAAFKSALSQLKKAQADIENCIAASRKLSAAESGIVGVA